MRARSGGQFAQILGSGQGGCVALGPGLQQLRYGFTVRLGCQFAQGLLGSIRRIALRAKGCV